VCRAVSLLLKGENLSWGSPNQSAEAAITSFIDEKKDFTYPTGCSGECGHYTQVVWATTTAVGCGTAQCPSLSILGGGAGQVSLVCMLSLVYMHVIQYVCSVL
jgi:Cysteine-rich secretory protein family